MNNTSLQVKLPGPSNSGDNAQRILFSAAFLVGLVGVFLSTAPLVVMTGAIILFLIAALLGSGETPPILLLPPLYQWSEVALPSISTVWLGVPFQSLSERGANLSMAAYYGLLGVLMLSLGIKFALDFRRRKPLLGGLRLEAKETPFRTIAAAAFTLIAIGYGFSAAANYVGGARELFNSTSELKNAGLFILAYWCLSTGRRVGVLIAVFTLEIAIGMTGYFADFKNGILVLFIAGIIARPKFGKGGLILALLGGVLILSVGVFWSSVKVDYRYFVNKGTGAQVLLVPFEDRFSFISSKLVEFGMDDAQAGFDQLVARHGYIDFLAQTMEHVPRFHPHEGGELTLGVARHILMPRVIFPDKPPLPSDTEIMAKYTGQAMLWDDNTSISLGHLAELYIDFGLVGGLLGMMLVGVFVAAVFRLIARHSRSPDLLKSGLCVMASLPLAYFGTAYVKLVGALVLTSLVALLLQRVVLPYLPSLSGLGGGGRKSPSQKLVYASPSTS